MAYGQIVGHDVDTSHLLHEACTSSQNDTPESLLRTIVEDLAPGDLAFGALSSNSMHHHTQQVVYFRVVDRFSNETGEHLLCILLAVFQAEPSWGFSQHGQHASRSDCKSTLEAKRETPGYRIVRNVCEAKVHPIGYDEAEDKAGQLEGDKLAPK